MEFENRLEPRTIASSGLVSLATDTKRYKRRIMDKIGTYFGVFEFGDDPSVVTEIMGVEPTRSWRKGDPIPNRPKGIQTHSRWELSYPIPDASFDEQIMALLSLLDQYRDQIHSIKNRFKAGVCCFGYFQEEYNPDLYISEETIQKLASLGLSIDFDIYFLGKD